MQKDLRFSAFTAQKLLRIRDAYLADLEFRASQEKRRTKRRVRKQKGESNWRVQQRNLAKAPGASPRTIYKGFPL